MYGRSRISGGSLAPLALLLVLIGLAATASPAFAVTLEAESSPLGEGAPVSAFSENLTLKAGSSSFTCTKSELSGTVKANGGEPSEVKLTKGSFTGSGKGGRCGSGSLTAQVEANVESTNWLLDLWQLEVEGVEKGGTGQIEAEKEGSLIQFKAVIFLGETKIGTCFYTAEKVGVEYELGVSLAFPGGLVIPTTNFKRTGESTGICAEEAQLSGTLGLKREAAAISVIGGGVGFNVMSLDFKGTGAGTKKVVEILNVGTAVAWLEDAWFEEGGKKTNDFAFYQLGAPTACALPGNKPFEKLNVNAKCEIGVEFASGAAGKKAQLVVEVQGFFRNSRVKMPVTS